MKGSKLIIIVAVCTFIFVLAIYYIVSTVDRSLNNLNKEQIEVCDEVIPFTYRGGQLHHLCYVEDIPLNQYKDYQQKVIIQWKKNRFNE